MTTESSLHIPTIRVLSQSIEFFNQGVQLQTIFSDMERTWLYLHTKDGKCPIIEHVGTTVKFNLVRRYAAELIKLMRNTLGLDIITKVIDKDSAFWIADDVVQRLSDSKTTSHQELFKMLLTAIFGISIDILNFMLNEEKTKNDLYGVLNQFYDLDIVDLEYDDVITLEELTEALMAYIENNEVKLFKVMEF